MPLILNAAKANDPEKPGVMGTFKGNGKPAKLAFVSVRRGEPFADKPTLVVVFTEKDHSREKKPEIKAGFGDFGSALIITAYDDGKIVGCEVAHAAHDKKPFSSIGDVATNGFKVGDGRVEGRVSSGGEQKTFGQTWEIDIQFAAPFSEAPSKTTTDAVPSKKKTRLTPEINVPADKPEPKKDTGPRLNVQALPLPNDATNVEHKKLVQQITCRSSSPVRSVASELTKKLADQGWARGRSDLVTAKSASLKRTRGEATLTIMVKAADDGSHLVIFTKGLDWEEPENSGR
jgi:hypothetical protein